MSNDSGSPGSAGFDSQASASAVGGTANIGRGTTVGNGAAKVFREFKWGLLTLFLLMVVVIGLVYDGGRRKKQPLAQPDNAQRADERIAEGLLDAGSESAPPAAPVNPTEPAIQQPVPPARPGGRPNGPIIVMGDPPAPPVPPAIHPSPQPVPEPIVLGNPAPPPAPAQTYKVKSGDTLTAIANSLLPGKGNLKTILEANKDVLPNPNRLRVGMVLKIPAALPAENQAPTAVKDEGGKKSEHPAPLPGNQTPVPDTHPGNEYVVQNGDSLERIARKLFNDGRKWRELYDWNREQLPDPGRLRAGQVLKLKPASANAAVSLPAPSNPRAETEAPKPSSQPNVQPERPEELPVMSRTSAANLP